MVACYPVTEYFSKSLEKSIIILRRASADLLSHASIVIWDSKFLLFYIFPSLFPLLNLRTLFLQNAANTLLSLWFLLTLNVCPLFFPNRFYASVISKLLKYYIGSEATKFRTGLHISRISWPETLSENPMNSRKIGLRPKQEKIPCFEKRYCMLSFQPHSLFFCC